MTKSVSASLEAHIDQEVTSLSTCWRLTRTDGKEYFFTDHDTDLVIDGNTYKASTGYNRTAVANNASMAVDNLDVVGILDDDSITERELRAGLFDYAEIKLFMVNWKDLSQGILRMRRGWLGEVTFTQQDIFKAELRGMTQVYSQRIGELYSPECRADLGDERCRVPIQPDLVERETAYETGDYVRVKDPLIVQIPIVNGSFEDGITGWTVVSGSSRVLQTNTISAKDGDYFFEGDGTTEITQTVDISSLIDTTVMDNGGYRFNLRSWRANSAGDTDDTGQLVVEALDGTSTVLGTLYDTGAEVFDGNWRRRNATNVAFPVGTRQVKITYTATLVAGLIANAALDGVYSWFTQDANNEVYELPLDNPSFEQGNTDGWTVNTGSPVVSFSGGQDGDWYLYGGTASALDMEQVLDLTTLPWFDTTIADAGNYSIQASFWLLRETAEDDTAQFRVLFLDSGGSTISVAYDSGDVFPANTLDWTQYTSLNVQIPANTRQIKVEILATLVDGAEIGLRFDNVSIDLTHTNYQKMWKWYDDRIYRCVSAGTTAEFQPNYDPTVGNQTTDGNAVFEAEQAWMRAGVVAAVSDRKTFEANLDESRAVDGWFSRGVLLWESGENRGRAIEVRTWNASDSTTTTTGTTTKLPVAGTAVLFLDMPYEITVGDEFRIYPGCDKRLNTCINKYDNVLNFRGEPYVPGQDEYLQYPDAK